MPPHMLCAQCGKNMLCIKNGALVGFNDGHAQIRADLYRCPECASIILTGFAREYMTPKNHVDKEELDFLFP